MNGGRDTGTPPALRAVVTAIALASGFVHMTQAAEHGGLWRYAFFADAALFIAAAGWVGAAGARSALRATGVLCAATAAAFLAVHLGGAHGAHHHEPPVAGVFITILELAAAAWIFSPRSRRGAAVVTMGAFLLAATPVVVVAQDHAQPTGCVTPNKRMTLYAEELPREDGRIRLGWGLTRQNASIPGPMIELVEGDCIAITVVNDVSYATLAELWRAHHDGANPEPDDAVGISLHVHGVKYTPSSDGTVQNDSWVPPKSSRTFVWYAAPRATVGGRVASLGTAGYWWYHDHIAGTDHGTGGVGAGLFGGMIVRRPGDLRPDLTYTVVLGPDTTINFKKYPETFACEPAVPSNHCFVARQGQRVEFLVLVIGENFHTFHLHAHTWADNRTGMLTSQADETRLIDVKTLGPSETMGFQLIAGEEVGPGIWMLHCHVQSHSDTGMSTFFKVLAPNGLDVKPGVPAMGHEH